jgi:NAD(P)-dependent dehydrogenase (short-subunit alcohol dehydrogenase family)
MSVNVRGVYLTCRATIPHLRSAGGGAIVVVASQLGMVAVPDAAAYCASKGAAVNLARAMALDHAAEGIRVNCVCPGPTDTPLVERFFAESGDADATRKAFEDAGVIGRLIEPAEIAEAIAYLADLVRAGGCGAHRHGGHAEGRWPGRRDRPRHQDVQVQEECHRS